MTLPLDGMPARSEDEELDARREIARSVRTGDPRLDAMLDLMDAADSGERRELPAWLDDPTSPDPGPRLPTIPACWEWEFDREHDARDGAPAAFRLTKWQGGRCALCGWHDPRGMVDDHDHQSGLTRGYLCASCNVREGVSGLRVFALYRWRHPTSILGLHLPYSGRGWKNGVLAASVPRGTVTG